MKITLLSVKNHKSFLDSGNVYFSPAFSIITGRNNSGKTSLIEALSPDAWDSKPHRGTAIDPGLEPEDSIATIALFLSGQEIRELLIRRGIECAIPSSPNDSIPPNIWIDVFFASSSIEINVERHSDYFSVSHCLVDKRSVGKNECRMRVTAQKTLIDVGFTGGWQLFFQLAQFLFQENIYMSKAARLSIGKNKIEGQSVLNPSSDNLSDALHSLYTSRRSRFDRLVRDMQLIFPNVGSVDMEISYETALVPNTLQNSQFAFVTTRIRIKGAPEDRDDLAFKLSDCGSGVGQVLSMLYIIHAAVFPKTIIIDEPNSFLHPGAARKLMDVFAAFPQHQYIVTTHSTETIAAIPEASLHLVKWDKGMSVVETLTSGEAQSSRKVLEELDVKLSDVFAADQIIWVEGPTERECFPIILKHLGIALPTGCRFIPVVSTSELARDSIRAQTLVDIYQSICKSNAILPPAIAISLDRESLNDEQVKAMRARFGGLVHFLERRCVENYTLNPDAIAFVLHGEGFSDEADQLQSTIKQWITDNAGSQRFKAAHEWDGTTSNSAWLKKVDGARLLSSLFTEVTDAKYIFNKVRHTSKLLSWILNNKPNEVEKLIEYVSNLII